MQYQLAEDSASDWGWAVVDLKTSVSIVRVLPEVSSRDLATGFYEASVDDAYVGTPVSWVYVQRIDGRSGWASPEWVISKHDVVR